jgi:phosphoenolpyruvate carboxykinase (ATP)
MSHISETRHNRSLRTLGFKGIAAAHWNLSPAELTEETIKRGQGTLSDTGALFIHTGKFTGRTPKDRFIVKDTLTKHRVDWGAVNQPFDAAKYAELRAGLMAYFEGKEVFARDNYVCADVNYRMNIRTFTEHPWSNMFADNMFLRPTERELATMTPDWFIINAPGYECPNPTEMGLNRGNFAVINFSTHEILIGGTGYTGEIKKGIFSVLNFELPVLRGVLPMHCSANVGQDGKTAIFFGLSGTGKTTLSADPQRQLIGDDEHGWSPEGVFNFEGGCYAKTIDLTEEKEPEIFRAIKHGAILENLVYHQGTRKPDYSTKEITENTRVSYPIHHIPNVVNPSKSGHPTDIFFLTCDATGVLPAISKLTAEQAMYYFISGYTSKVPGTEDGVAKPEPTFSACFGAPFMPLHPTEYAKMLGKMMTEHRTDVWLVNTGWLAGGFEASKRIKLSHTRALITAALTGELDTVEYTTLPIFNLKMPKTCPNVPSELLNPRETWTDSAVYDVKANNLATAFNAYFEKFSSKTDAAILNAAPQPTAV